MRIEVARCVCVRGACEWGCAKREGEATEGVVAFPVCLATGAERGADGDMVDHRVASTFSTYSSENDPGNEASNSAFSVAVNPSASSKEEAIMSPLIRWRVPRK